MPRLYDRMDDLLKIGVAIPYIAEVLTEVFTGVPELCLKVREDQVAKLFQMVVSVKEEEGRAALVLTLQAIAKVKGYGNDRVISIWSSKSSFF